MTGEMTFYDKPTAWGLIAGDDGRLYVVRGDQVLGPSPQVGEKVCFEALDTTTGLRAVGVRRI
jgi:cold shock CspA family protein